MRRLFGTYRYRLDTNFAKMDRIVHPGIEKFKSHVLNTKYKGMTIAEWNRLLFRGQEKDIISVLNTQLDITKAQNS